MKVYTKSLVSLFLITLSFPAALRAESGPLKDGASLYRNCYYCHSLKSGVHLTGPSLADIWGKKSGENRTFKLYSDALKHEPITWNEETLKAWIRDPKQLVPETTMTFNGLKDEESVANLVTFLKLAAGPDGYQKVIDQKLLDKETADGQLPKDVSQPKNSEIVASVEHCGDIYRVKTADGRLTEYWELNLDFKINSGPWGPPKTKPVRISTGSMGDRFTILFQSEGDLKKIFKPCSPKSKIKAKPKIQKI